MPTAHFVNGRRLISPFPEGAETVMVGMGCFWGAEKMFWQLQVSESLLWDMRAASPKILSVVCSGLTGRNEVVLVVFDPESIDFQEILRVFWERAHYRVCSKGMTWGRNIDPEFYLEDEDDWG